MRYVGRDDSMNKFIHHEGRLNNNMQKWRKRKKKKIIIGNL